MDNWGLHGSVRATLCDEPSRHVQQAVSNTVFNETYDEIGFVEITVDESEFAYYLSTVIYMEVEKRAPVANTEQFLDKQ